MRFEAIEMPAYGPFANASLDLSEGRGKLEIVYGPNEAGKSSLLRAISDFLFGIPAQTPDNFLHPYPTLRIRATIESAGKRLCCVRRKAASNSLRGADDDEVISEETLRSYVPIQTRDVFQAMFGLNAERLQQGGEELLRGQSEFGQLLFSAAAGIVGLHNILKTLCDEAEKLFKPRATTATLPKVLDHLKESKDRLRQAQVTLTGWHKLQEEYQSALNEISRLERDILLNQGEAERYRRIQLSLSHLRRRSELRQDLLAVQNAPLLRDSFATDYQKAASDLILKAGEVERSTSRVNDLQSEVEAIVLPTALLAREQELLNLYQDAGARIKAAGDRLRLQTELHQAELEMTQILRNLGEGPDLESVPALAVQAAEKRSVQDLSISHARLDAEIQNSQKSLAQEEQTLKWAQEKLEELPPTRPVGSLRAAVQGALVAEAAELKGRSLNNSAAEEDRKVAVELKALPWPSSAEALENSALPSDQLVAEWTSRLDKIEHIVDQAQERLQTANTEVMQLEGILARLQAGGSVPTLSELRMQRQHRDLGWKAVRSAWLDGHLDSPEAQEFLQQPAEAPSLADAYEDSVNRVDQTADHLREDADQVAKLEQTRAAINSARQVVATREAELDQVRAARRKAQMEWEEVWKPFDVKAEAPRQMTTWLHRRRSVLERGHAVDAKRAQASELLAEAETAKRRLQECLLEIGETATPSSDTLLAWRLLAERVLQGHEDLTGQRDKFESQIEASGKAIAAAKARVDNAKTSLDGWGRKWAALMTNLGLSADIEPSTAEEVIRVREDLQTHYRTAASHAARIAGIDRDEKRFREQVRRLLESVAPDLLSLPEVEAIGELHQRLTDAKRQEEVRSSKEKDLRRENQTLQEAQGEVERTKNRLAALALEAGCENAQRLPLMIEESLKRKTLEKALRDVEEYLGTIGMGQSIAELEEEAAGVDRDQIPGQLELITRQLQESQTELKSAEEKRVTIENELKRMEDVADSCAASADIEAYKAEALEAVEQYIRLELARKVLQGAVDQYRRKTEGDMLKRSSELFSLLTGASFSGLKLDWDEAGHVALVGVRSRTEDIVRLESMSDGTRDQLYLALRLASVELYARDHEPIPFILDDILVRFDNNRAASAVRSLAQLAERSQVLLFTHHLHLVELAKDSLDARQLAISEISCRLAQRSTTATI